jgi:hypothetical protein
MFWKVLLAAAVAIGLIQLDALYVWVSVLKAMLGVVLAVAVCVGLLFLWRRYKRPDMH